MRSKTAPPDRNYSHVRSSGYLTPKYRYRRLPTSMSWLDEDTDLNDIDWRRGPQSPEPQLDDFIQKVLQNKRIPITRKKENAYKSALYLAASIVEAAFELEWLYQTYIRNTDRKPVISDFRAVDKNIYVGLVPLRKPTRLDSFTVAYRSPGDLPTHRMLLHINKKLTAEERSIITNEWGHCLDSHGYVRPDFVLHWFNKGLIKACRNLEVENKRTQKLAFLETSVAEDGTLWIHIVGFDQQQNYKINMVPCIPVSELPKQLCLKAPIPSRRPYNGSHCKFLREVHQGIESGEEILFVEARLQKWSPSLRCSPTIQLSWGIHIGQLEDRAFGFLNSLTKTKVFEDVVILINAIKEEHAYCLHAVTNKVINHAMFFQNRRSLGKLTQTQDWLLAVLRTIQVQMRLNMFPNFFLSKQNIFMESNSQVLKFNYDELTRLIRNLKKYPASLCCYTGCEELGKNESEKSDDNGDSHDESNEKSTSVVHFSE